MKSKLREFVIRDVLSQDDQEKINDHTNLLEIGLDSLGIIQLVDFIETEYQIDLPPEEVIPLNMKNITAIESLIQKVLNNDNQIEQINRIGNKDDSFIYK